MYFYSNKLIHSIRKFFEIHNFEPENKFEADTFLRSVFDVDANKNITVNLKQPVSKIDKDCDKIVADKNNYLDLFYPDVWKQLNLGQKLQAITFAYKNIIESETDLLNNPPQLLFNCENCGYKGVFYTRKGKSFIEISLLNLENKHPLNFLATLRHELLHCQQDIYISNLSKKILHNNKKGITNDFLDSYSTNLLIDNYDYARYCNDIAKDKDLIELYKKQKNFNEEDFAYIQYWQKIKFNEDWDELLHLTYLVQDLEYSAFNKGAKIVKQANEYFKNNFKNYNEYVYDNTSKMIKSKIKQLNNQYNFKLDYDDIKELKNINTMLTAGNLKNNNNKYTVEQIYVNNPKFFETINWKMIKILLFYYNDKKITSKISTSLLNKSKDKIQQAIDSVKEL